MTQTPAFSNPPQNTSMSKSSLLSLIFGILSCIPGAGLLAILLGIIGFIRTANPFRTGRWMAIVGTILGLLASIAYAVIIATMGLGFLSFSRFATDLQAPAAATHDFIQGLANDDPALVSKNDGGFTPEDLQGFRDAFHSWGKFTDTTFNKRSFNDDKAHVEGTADFEKANVDIEADLRKIDGQWKVVRLKYTSHPK